MNGRDDLAQLYAELDADIRRYVRRRFPAAPGHIADDASGATWEIATRQWDRIRTFPPHGQRGYLLVVARHEALRELTRRDRAEHEPDELLCGSYTVDAALEARELLRAVARLPRPAREAVEGRLRGDSHVQSAERTGRTRRAIDRHVTDGRARLRAVLAC